MLDAYFIEDDVDEELEMCDDCLIEKALGEYRDGKTNFFQCKNILKRISKS